MSTEAKAVLGLTAGLAAVAATTFTPKTAPHWVWEIVQTALMLFLMALSAVGAVAWERYGPNGCRLDEWEATRAANEPTGIQLLDRDEVEYDEPATLHFPEGGER